MLPIFDLSFFVTYQNPELFYAIEIFSDRTFILATILKLGGDLGD